MEFTGSYVIQVYNDGPTWCITNNQEAARIYNAFNSILRFENILSNSKYFQVWRDSRRK